MRLIKKFFLIVSVLINYNLFSQSKVDLEKQKSSTLNELSINTNLYDKVKKQKKESIVTISLINNKINSHQELIHQMDREIDNLNKKISDNEIIIQQTTDKEQQIKKELSSIIYNLNKNRASNPMMILFSSKNLNVYYKRVQYFKEINLSYNSSIKELKRIEYQLATQIATYSNRKMEKENISNKKIHEVEFLKKDKDEKETILKKLSKREKELFKLIEDQKRIERELEIKIRELAQKEIKNSNSIYSKLTPDEKRLSKGFESNKKNLPWPTIKGVVTSFYGKHEHPVLKGVFVNNNGIDITTENNSVARVIFDGVVTKVFTIKGCNFVVIVRHGNYLSVYQNLSSVSIKNGQLVKTKQNIGLINIDENSEVSTLHFEIWEELKKLDPLQWLTN